MLGHRRITPARSRVHHFSRGREILLRVDLHVAAVGVDAVERRALLDHVLEEIDEIRLLERPPLAPRLARRCPWRRRRVVRRQQLACAVRRELGHADELPARGLRRDAPGQLDDAVALGPHLLGVALGVLGARDVAPAPVGVADEHFVVRRGDGLLHGGAPVDDVRVRRDEAAPEVVARVEERRQDVVPLPLGVLHEGELGVPGADDVGPVAADVHDVPAREARGPQGLEDPLEHRPAHHGHERLGDVVGLRAEAAAPSGTDHDGPHG